MFFKRDLKNRDQKARQTFKCISKFGINGSKCSVLLTTALFFGLPEVANWQILGIRLASKATVDQTDKMQQGYSSIYKQITKAKH